jgi:hypothetical protein
MHSSPMHATWPTHLTIVDFIILTIFGRSTSYETVFLRKHDMYSPPNSCYITYSSHNRWFHHSKLWRSLLQSDVNHFGSWRCILVQLYSGESCQQASDCDVTCSTYRVTDGCWRRRTARRLGAPLWLDEASTLRASCIYHLSWWDVFEGVGGLYLIVILREAVTLGCSARLTQGTQAVIILIKGSRL